jgi:hypothetical protein
MNDLTVTQRRVFNEAKSKLENRPWYVGVCMDNFPSDEQILLVGFKMAVSRVILETAMLDDPNIYG